MLIIYQQQQRNAMQAPAATSCKLSTQPPTRSRMRHQYQLPGRVAKISFHRRSHPDKAGQLLNVGPTVCSGQLSLLLSAASEIAPYRQSHCAGDFTEQPSTLCAIFHPSLLQMSSTFCSIYCHQCTKKSDKYDVDTSFMFPRAPRTKHRLRPCRRSRVESSIAFVT